MALTHHTRGGLLEKALIMYVSLLLMSLLLIFAIDPSIYTTTLWPGWVPAERYPWPVFLFLGALIAFLGMLIYGVLHRWRWLFWPLLIAWASSAIQIPVEGLQLLGIFPNPYPIWYSLFRVGVGGTELGFAFWMFQTYRRSGVWGVRTEEHVGKLVQTASGLIEYRDVGQGPVVLILNGGHTNCFSPLGDEPFFLEQGYRLLIPSRPGYGKTPSSTGKTAAAFAEALVGLLDHLQQDQVIVVGISAGGPTALQLAGLHPERVSKVILQNAAIDGRYASGLIRLGTYVLFNPLLEGLAWAAFRAWGRVAPRAALKRLLWGLTSLPIDHVLASMSPEQQQGALAFLQASRSGSGFLHDIHHHCGDLSRVRAPIIIIRSKYDGLVDASHALYVQKHIPQTQLFVSEAESHLIWFSKHKPEIQARMSVFLHS